MGLFDNLLGSAEPRGGIAKQLGLALLAYLAYRAMNSGNRTQPAPAAGGMPATGMPGAAEPESPGLVAQGLEWLVQRLQQSGYGDIVNSWVASGPNRPISPDQLQQGLGHDAIEDLSRRTNLPQQEVVSELTRFLPEWVDRLTPGGRMPSQAELARFSADQR